MMPAISLPTGDQWLIDTWKDAVFAATAHAPRFKVLPGEALLVDNYTCLHVREGYEDMGRRSWRVWMWVEGACYGGPDWIRDANGRRDKAFAKVVWA